MSGVEVARAGVVVKAEAAGAEALRSLQQGPLKRGGLGSGSLAQYFSPTFFKCYPGGKGLHFGRGVP